MEAVVDADGGEDIEVILDLILRADESGVGLEDSMGGQDRGVGDSEVGDAVGHVEIDTREGDAEDGERDEDGPDEVAAFGLGESKFGHGDQG